MRVLLVGGAGLIGSYLSRELVENGHEVTILDALVNYLSPFDKNGQLSQELLGRRWSIDELLHLRFGDIREKIHFIRGDVRHKGRFTEILYKKRPNKVVLLAAIPLSSESNIFSEDAFSVNTAGAVNILEVLRGVDFVDQFIYTSSSMIYGDFKKIPCDEDHDTDPIDIYGGTKLCGEILTKAYSRQYDIPYTILRPSAIYGPTDVNRRVVQIFLENGFKGKPIKLHNGGESRLDFTCVEDAAHAFMLALERPESINQTFNITRGEGHSLKELAKLVKGYFPDLVIEKTDVSRGEQRSERGALDITKARNLLGYEPKYTLEMGLEKYYNFLLDEKNRFF